DAERVAALVDAKARGERRATAEARIPTHLLYVKGWPTVMPTLDEAALLCEVRAEVAAAVGLEIRYTTPAEVVARYAELMVVAAAKAAAKARRGAAPAVVVDDDAEDNG